MIRRGRPRIDQTSQRLSSVTVEADIIEHIKAWADAERVGVSEAHRRLLRAGMKARSRGAAAQRNAAGEEGQLGP